VTSPRTLYLEILDLLEKVAPPTTNAAETQRILEGYDPQIEAVLLDILKKARSKFLRGFKDLPETDAALRDFISALVFQSFGRSNAALVNALLPLAKDIITTQTRSFGIATTYEQANEKVLRYLNEQADNVFSTLTADQADAVYQAIADAKSDEHTLKDVISGIRSSFGNSITYYLEDGGIRTLDNQTWATMVARTEGTRAASNAMLATLQEAGAQTWRWMTEGSACGQCALNEDEVVGLGDDFPSGDSSPPSHPNCRCICVPNVTELTTMQDNEPSSEEAA
jgi:hypothetical protein